MKAKKPNNNSNSFLKYSGIAFQMGIVIVAGMFGGLKLDKLFKTNFPVFTLVLSLFAVFTAIYIAIKDFIKK